MDTDSSSGDLGHIPLYCVKLLTNMASLLSSDGKPRLGMTIINTDLSNSPVTGNGSKPEQKQAIKRESDPVFRNPPRISMRQTGTVHAIDLFSDLFQGHVLGSVH